MRLWNYICFDPDERPGGAPWSDDLRAALGEDHGSAFDAVDGYLRSSWQPRVTELEEGTKDARELWKDLTNDEEAPTAVARLVHQLYGDDFVQKYVGLFDDEETTPPAAAEETTTPPADAADGLNDEERAWLRERREREQAEARDTAYATTKRDLIETYNKDRTEDDPSRLTDDDAELLDAFLAAAPDADTAIAMYQSYQGKLRERLGVTTPAPTPTPEPPPVLGSEGASSATPPAKSQFTKWDDLFKDGGAVDTYFDRQAVTTTPPPVIG